ncbi:Holliday junction resolvase RuvX [Anaerolineae bacterium CFX7]|nr:Holliday junction resolvase RuvX [Anaerolineae bacterium CFX7]
MRYLGLDVGNKRVGVAVGNSVTRLASPLAVIVRATLAQDAAQLAQWIREYDAETLVVGLPRNADDSDGVQAALTRAYAEELQTQLGLPLHYQDERYSTATARRAQQARGLNEKRGRATLDAVAAAVILQDFLDALPPS